MSTNKAIAYLDKAVGAITQLGLTEKKEDLPVQNLIQQVSEFGPDQAMSIALVLARQGTFNELVRQEITGMEVANRYELITSSFTSICWKQPPRLWKLLAWTWKMHKRLWMQPPMSAIRHVPIWN